MNKTIVKVPKGIRYVSDWENFFLPDHPCIIDKKLTGCGFTEYVIRGNFNAILISPRKMLLENKVDQHNPKIPGTDKEDLHQRVIYYAKSELKEDLSIDKDLLSSKPRENEGISIVDEKSTEGKVLIQKFKDNLKDAILAFLSSNRPVKICCTYDSFRKVKEVLEKEFPWLLPSMYSIVDEMQSIFTDSRFKPDTEMEFVTDLQNLQKVCFVSATPMMEEYLDLIDEFKDLPYYELDWESEDPNRIVRPEIIAKPTRSINETAKKIISEFKDGKFHMKSLVDNQGNPVKVVEARELIIYVNSVKNISDIIRQNKLTVEETSIICADTKDNRKKIRNSFLSVYRDLGRNSREIPKEEEILSKVSIPDKITGVCVNKPITLCTKTVYLGADFYSKCARSIVLSDSIAECLAVDITLDLPQIIGRQRDIENPWKNSLEIWFKSGYGVGDISEEQFENLIKEKIEATESMLRTYDRALDQDKCQMAKVYEDRARSKNYKEDYVSVNRHTKSNIKPQFNNLVMISERRAFDIQQKDYKDRFTVFNRLEEVFGLSSIDLSKDIDEMLEDINSQKFFTGKMRRCCEYILQKGEDWINFLEDPYRTYIHTLGVSFISSQNYQKGNLDAALVNRGMMRIFSKEDLDEVVTGYFEVGKKYTCKTIISDLGEIYKRLGILTKPRAVDLEKWFELKRATTKIDGKRYEGYELIKLK